ncbi:MucR family transcriptional regulator [Pseudooceanicola aestuarii]|uniref:MucR family transcriptional regulator n=1 Tax=Pseudooceanicola aestuarii TaxID=2697319 RepID=UPI0013D19D53|nr:MucR family transcriptional regulator [Pseudooceanicola aestuarii]
MHQEDIEEQAALSETAERHAAIGHIVAAYAGRLDVSADDIVALYSRLSGRAQALGSTAAGTTPGAAPDQVAGLTPALPIDRAVTEDKVFCLVCGRGFKMLKRHLGAEHGMTEAEYRAAFDLPEDFPLVAPSYSRRKARHAREAGFGKYDRSELAE